MSNVCDWLTTLWKSGLGFAVSTPSWELEWNNNGHLKSSQWAIHQWRKWRWRILKYPLSFTTAGKACDQSCILSSLGLFHVAMTPIWSSWYWWNKMCLNIEQHLLREGWQALCGPLQHQWDGITSTDDDEEEEEAQGTGTPVNDFFLNFFITHDLYRQNTSFLVSWLPNIFYWLPCKVKSRRVSEEKQQHE